MVGNLNSIAYARLDSDYNFYGYPTCFFDGGYRVFIGGSSTQSYYRTRIEQSGARTVQPLNMIVGVNWAGDDEIEIKIKIGNGVPVNTAPPDPATPTGVIRALQTISYDFETTNTDPDGDSLYYQFAWGNGDTTEWQGPFGSGESCILPYIWNELGTYDVTVRAKDAWQAVTGWSTPRSVEVVCCDGDRGNIQLIPDCDILDQAVDISDLTNMIDHMFINYTPICCLEEADIAPLIDGSVADGIVDIGDVTGMINHLFINYPVMPVCP